MSYTLGGRYARAADYSRSKGKSGNTRPKTWCLMHLFIVSNIILLYVVLVRTRIKWFVSSGLALCMR